MLRNAADVRANFADVLNDAVALDQDTTVALRGEPAAVLVPLRRIPADLPAGQPSAEASVTAARDTLYTIVDAARDDGRITYITSRGRRVAAIAPLGLVYPPAG